jgi:acyl dehydratase
MSLMVIDTILPMFLAFAGPNAGPNEIQRVEVEESVDATSVLVYDGDEVTAEIVLWSGDDDRVHLDANFADGEYMRAVIDGDELVEHEASPAADLRVAALVETTAASGWHCAAHVLHMVAECVGPKFLCPLAMVWSACSCSDTFAEDHPNLCE